MHWQLHVNFIHLMMIIKNYGENNKINKKSPPGELQREGYLVKVGIYHILTIRMLTDFLIIHNNVYIHSLSF